MTDETYTKSIIGVIATAIVALIPGLRKINKAAVVLKSQFEAHEKTDDQRHEDNLKKFDKVTDTLEKITDVVNDVRESTARIEGRLDRRPIR